MPLRDLEFAGSIPELYEEYLVPLIFQPYADDLAAHVARRQPRDVLEVAAGTGVVTRQLARLLPPSTAIVATDLNQPMLDRAVALGTSRPVRWQQANALQLPFPDGTFDVVACQFGVMFFPDKARAFAEARRVLRDGGLFIFNTWDRIEENEFADTVTRSLAQVFPDDPPRFLARVPHGYYDAAVINGHLLQGGFTAPPAWRTLAARSRAASPDIPARAYCQGTPLRNEIEDRAQGRLDEIAGLAAHALARRFGGGGIDGKIQAHIVAVER
jgi:SAM-dependent methyltransferase